MSIYVQMCEQFNYHWFTANLIIICARNYCIHCQSIKSPRAAIGIEFTVSLYDKEMLFDAISIFTGCIFLELQLVLMEKSC